MSETRPILLTWAALVALVALTVAGSFAFSGTLSLVTWLSIAVAKTALIFWVFMHLREDRGLLRIFAVGAIAWLMILFAFGGLAYVPGPT
jgi:cytochrome c oxidase subunit 4